MSNLEPITSAVRRVRGRLRLQRAADLAVLAALPALVLVDVALVLAKLRIGQPHHGAHGAPVVTWLFASAIAVPVVAAIAGALRPVPPLLAARLLDRTHGLHDRVASTLAFAAVPEDERTEFMRAAIDDGRGHAGGLRAARALPFRWPRDVVAAAGLGLATLALSLLAPPRVVPHAVTHPVRRIEPAHLHPDDIAAFRDAVTPITQNEGLDRDVRQSALDVDALLDRLANDDIDRDETLRRLAEIQAQLDVNARHDEDEMRDALQRLADPLATARETQPAAEALRDADARRAAAELQRTADALRHDPPSAQELARLQEALRRASDAAEHAPSDDELHRQEDALHRMEDAQHDKAAPSPSERRLLQRQRDAVQRTRDQRQRAQEQRRRLDRLQRSMRDASQHLDQHDQQGASNDLDQSAEELSRMADSQMSESERERLRQQVEQLRELVRQQQQQAQQQGQQGQGQQGHGQQGHGQQGQQGQGQQGQGQQGQGQQGQGQQGQGQSQMDRFVLQANGQQGQGQQANLHMPGQGQQGRQAQPGQGQQGQGQGQQGQQGGSPGGDQPGQGQQPGQMQLGVSPNGQGNAQLMLPGQGSERGQGDPNGDPQPGSSAGVGHDATNLDDPTRLNATHTSAQAAGRAGSEGPTRSQVIYGASERGFASQDYERVYQDYEHHAEEVLEEDQVPSGYRFYVRRYFQLIRPRDHR